ncbi:MAG TPA: hypothetical protein VFP26_10700 [Gemmatimonadaceae bacterium]|nr:hypothetical protein [Gemmatimonadaceae bacterium]
MRREIGLAALIAIATANGCKENRWVPRGRAEIVLSEIKLRGANEVSRRLDSDEDFAKTVLAGIASGDSVWLDVAAQLQPPSAAAEASLAMALASALPHAPRKVLTLVGDDYSADEVCGMPFLKADSSEVIAYHDQAISALTAVKDSSLASAVGICRTALDSSRSRRLQRIDPSYIIKNKPGRR